MINDFGCTCNDVALAILVDNPVSDCPCICQGNVKDSEHIRLMTANMMSGNLQICKKVACSTYCSSFIFIVSLPALCLAIGAGLGFCHVTWGY